METRCLSNEVQNTVLKQKRKWVKGNLEKVRAAKKWEIGEGTEVSQWKSNFNFNCFH